MTGESEQANKRAEQLLRGYSEAGARLANGDGVPVQSRACADITYGVLPQEHGAVQVFHREMGYYGSICIQSAEEAPPADVLLTRLLLCEANEQKLWTTGNFRAYSDFGNYFLPDPIQEWVRERRRLQTEEFAHIRELVYSRRDVPTVTDKVLRYVFVASVVVMCFLLLLMLVSALAGG